MKIIVPTVQICTKQQINYCVYPPAMLYSWICCLQLYFPTIQLHTLLYFKTKQLLLYFTAVQLYTLLYFTTVQLYRNVISLSVDEVSVPYDAVLFLFRCCSYSQHYDYHIKICQTKEIPRIIKIFVDL